MPSYPSCQAFNGVNGCCRSGGFLLFGHVPMPCTVGSHGVVITGLVLLSDDIDQTRLDLFSYGLTLNDNVIKKFLETFLKGGVDQFFYVFLIEE